MESTPAILFYLPAAENGTQQATTNKVGYSLVELSQKGLIHLKVHSHTSGYSFSGVDIGLILVHSEDEHAAQLALSSDTRLPELRLWYTASSLSVINISQLTYQGIKAILVMGSDIRPEQKAAFDVRLYFLILSRLPLLEAVEKAWLSLGTGRPLPKVTMYSREWEYIVSDNARSLPAGIYLADAGSEKLLQYRIPFKRDSGLPAQLLQQIQSEKIANKYLLLVLDEMCRYNLNVGKDLAVQQDGKWTWKNFSEFSLVLARNLPQPLQKGIEKLMQHQEQDAQRIQALIQFYQSNAQLLYFILLADLLAYHTEQKIEFLPGLQLSSESQASFTYFDFLREAVILYRTYHATDWITFIPEIEPLYEQYKQMDGWLRKAHNYLEELRLNNDAIDNYAFACEKTEAAVSTVLKYSAFLTDYRLEILEGSGEVFLISKLNPSRKLRMSPFVKYSEPEYGFLTWEDTGRLHYSFPAISGISASDDSDEWKLYTDTRKILLAEYHTAVPNLVFETPVTSRLVQMPLENETSFEGSEPSAPQKPIESPVEIQDVPVFIEEKPQPIITVSIVENGQAQAVATETIFPKTEQNHSVAPVALETALVEAQQKLKREHERTTKEQNRLLEQISTRNIQIYKLRSELKSVRRFWLAFGVMALGLGLFLLWTNHKGNLKRIAEKGVSLSAEGKYREAAALYTQLTELKLMTGKAPGFIIDSLTAWENKILRLELIDRLIYQGDSLMAIGKMGDALDRYLDAQVQASDMPAQLNVSTVKVASARQTLDVAFDEYVTMGNIFYDNKNCEKASKYYAQALSLKQDEAVQKRFLSCR